MAPFIRMGSSRMDMVPACEAVKALGHSPPGLHWWLTLTAADQGAWISGIGSLAAVGTTVGLTWWVDYRRRKEVRDRAVAAEKIFAMRLQRPLTKIGTDLGNAAHGVRRLELGNATGASAMLKVDGQEELAELSRRAEDSLIAAPELMAALVEIETTVEAHNRTVDLIIPLLDDAERDEEVMAYAPIVQRNLLFAQEAVERAISMFGKHNVRVASLIYAIGKRST